MEISIALVGFPNFALSVKMNSAVSAFAVVVSVTYLCVQNAYMSSAHLVRKFAATNAKTCLINALHNVPVAVSVYAKKSGEVRVTVHGL